MNPSEDRIRAIREKVMQVVQLVRKEEMTRQQQ